MGGWVEWVGDKWIYGQMHRETNEWVEDSWTDRWTTCRQMKWMDGQANKQIGEQLDKLGWVTI
jgi:hypothetical protein